MQNNYEHYITKNIQAFYKKRLFSPIIYLLLTAFLWLLFPLGDMLHPKTLQTDSLDNSYHAKERYVSTTFHNLKFSGYTSTSHDNTNGYYYYTMYKDQCIIVLLSPHTCEEGLPLIESLSVTGCIVEGKENYQKLLSRIATDLDWTEKGISNQMSPYFFSEPDYQPTATRLLFVIYFSTMAYALCSLIACLLYIRAPRFSPPCQNLVVYGRPARLLTQAEEELATLPQLATEDMFITEHFFIMTSPYANAIVPINEILWIYKHSTLHKFLWYHFSISYTMHITATRHVHIHCPKNTKSDIDGIMDYLAEANHNILVGFNEENRLKVQAVQEKPFHVEKLFARLHHRKKINLSQDKLRQKK